MTSRPTPFGLLAGFSPGVIGPRSKLVLSGPLQDTRRLRINPAAIETVLRTIAANPRLRAKVPFQLDPGLHLAGGRVHYPDLEGGAMVSVDPDPVLRTLLDEKPGAMRLDRWAQRLRRISPALTSRRARTLIGELVAAGMLVPALSVPIGDRDPTASVITLLGAEPALRPIAARLRAATKMLADLERSPRPASAREIRKVESLLHRLPGAPEVRSAIQADLVRPAPGLSLGTTLVGEIRRGIHWLHRWSAGAESIDPLAEFRRRFRERYGDREVPLLEALDSEVGIGLDEASEASRATDLRDAWLLGRLAAVWSSGATTLELGWNAADEIGLPEPTWPLPDAIAALGVVGADSSTAIDEGHFQFFLRGIRGPSGTEVIGRLGLASPALATALRRHLAAEAALDPEAIFADVVHLPSARLAPIQCRPPLRSHQILVSGRAAVSAGRIILLGDLVVSVPAPGDRTRLRSVRLDRRVEPRLTSAHQATAGDYPPWRFLWLLQREGVTSTLGWDWGRYTAAPFLPRVTLGRLVLARARWTVSPAEIGSWREEPKLPRHIVLVEDEGELAVDLDDPHSVKLLTDRAGQAITVEELYPVPDQLAVTGPEGRFAHDIVVPFLRNRAVTSIARRPAQRGVRQVREAEPVVRSFPPGSDWLQLHIYGGRALADQVLAADLAPLMRRLETRRVIDRWFFIRYRDPDPHIRLRAHGEPERLLSEVLPAGRTALERAFGDRSVWRLVVETYDREIERFGGPSGIVAAEQVFHHDSIAVCRLIAAGAGDLDDRERVALCVLTTDRLLDDFTVAIGRRVTLLEALLARRAKNADDAKDARLAAGEETRRDRDLLERPRARACAGVRLDALAARSSALTPVAARIRTLARTGRLSVPVDRLVEDVVHLHLNRLLPAGNRREEAVVLAWLAKLYRSRLARGRD